jgi:hypothetical protein
MNSVEAKIVSWQHGVLSIRLLKEIPEGEPHLYFAIAKVNGEEIIDAGGVISGVGNSNGEIFFGRFDPKADFKVGSICVVTWEKYLEWC